MNRKLKDQVVTDLTQLRFILASMMSVVWTEKNKGQQDLKAHISRIGRTSDEVKALKDDEGLAPGTKCIVKGCDNKVGEGEFVGDLCTPCHLHLTTGKSYQSAAFRLAVDATHEYMRGK